MVGLMIFLIVMLKDKAKIYCMWLIRLQGKLFLTMRISRNFSVCDDGNLESPIDKLTDLLDVLEFHLDDYLTALKNFKSENKHHFSKLQTRSATDDQILLVDELITVTMILRNISFAEYNKEPMAGNRLFKDLLFSTVKSVALNNDKFVFSRKRLCLLKDCL